MPKWQPAYRLPDGSIVVDASVASVCGFLVWTAVLVGAYEFW